MEVDKAEEEKNAEDVDQSKADADAIRPNIIRVTNIFMLFRLMDFQAR